MVRCPACRGPLRCTRVPCNGCSWWCTVCQVLMGDDAVGLGGTELVWL